MKYLNLTDKVITGYWDGQPIWRKKTAEEVLQQKGIDPTTADLGLAIMGIRNDIL